MKDQIINILKNLIKLNQRLLDYYKKNMIEKWANAIKEHEGFYEGSRSYRNNNPGNLRFNYQYGTIGKDKDDFAIFKSYDVGFNALCHQLTIACNGDSKIYNPEMTLLQFFELFAPSSDNNNPLRYAQFVADKLDVPITIHIKEFLMVA